MISCNEKYRKEKSGLVYRELEPSDYDKGFLSLLGQLTETPIITKEKFVEILHLNTAFAKIIVAENDQKKLIATVKIKFDYKFSRNGGKVAFFEDIVVHKDYRKKGVGSILIQIASEIAQKNNCYKIIGSCKENLMEFYEKNGFQKLGVSFGKYFN